MLLIAFGTREAYSLVVTDFTGPELTGRKTVPHMTEAPPPLPMAQDLVMLGTSGSGTKVGPVTGVLFDGLFRVPRALLLVCRAGNDPSSITTENQEFSFSREVKQLSRLKGPTKHLVW